MAGRGGARGRGGRGGLSKSFNKEQLAAMGAASATEVLPGPVTQPPPLYPLLDRKPVPFVSTGETDYLLMLKQDFIDRMQLSPSYIQMPLDKNLRSEHQIDRLVAQIPSVKGKFDWTLFPSELRPRMLAKRSNKSKIVKAVDVLQTLNQLESLETADQNKEDKDETNEDAPADEEELLEEEPDEEMDDGTDYANNYFDNGEGYEDEDDNLDDGPIF